MITKFVFRLLLAVGLLLAMIGSSLPQACPPGSVFANQVCYCPYGTHHFGMFTFTVQCGSSCPPCTPDYERPQPRPSDDSVSKNPSPARANPAAAPSLSKGDEHTVRMPAIGRVPWGISGPCLPALQYLVGGRSRGIHGAIAVTKDPINGGCGHSWSPGTRSKETYRAEALAYCEKYGPDCRIVYEQ